MLFFEASWNALGPFPIGTREDPWHDTVDFSRLEVSEQTFSTALGTQAHWKKIHLGLSRKEPFSTAIGLELSYPECLWQDLVKVHGWSVTQFDAWIRGYLVCDHHMNIRLSVQNSPEFLLDGVRYEGDIYANAKHITLPISEGRHVLDVRIVNEVRVFGYKQDPCAQIVIEVSEMDNTMPLIVVPEYVPDFILDGTSITSAAIYFGLRVTNNSNHDITIEKVESPCIKESLSLPSRLGACQTRILPFSINKLSHKNNVQFFIRLLTGSQQVFDTSFELVGYHKPLSIESPRLITYLNRDKTIGTAVLHPPNSQSQQEPRDPSPIILALHGAGVDIETAAWKDIFTGHYRSAWILQPNCGTWGDDWHSLSALSIESALLAIPGLIKHLKWSVSSPDLTKILIMGHSNGGQGAMQFMVRNSDCIIGAAWAAGYTSIARYVPQNQWTTNARVHADNPQYDIVRNLEMIKGIRTFVRHGTADENVPIYHSRLLASLEGDIALEEVQGQGHWYDGILTSGRLRDFVEDCLKEPKVTKPTSFSVLSWGRPMRRGGFIIDEVERSATLPAKLHIQFNPSHSSIHVATHGVVSWRWLDHDSSSLMDFYINGKHYTAEDFKNTSHTNSSTHTIVDRRDITAILESTGPISIVAPSAFPHRIAHSLLLYHNLDSVIICQDEDLPNDHNAIICKLQGRSTRMTISIKQDRDRVIATLEAADDLSMSKLIRLLPWRTGVGVSGHVVIDTRATSNIILEARDVDFVQIDRQT